MGWFWKKKEHAGTPDETLTDESAYADKKQEDFVEQSSPLPPLFFFDDEILPENNATTEDKKGWFSRLKEGLSRSSAQISDNLKDLFEKRKLDDEALDDLEDILIQADIGVKTATFLREKLTEKRFGKEISSDELKQFLADEIETLLKFSHQPLIIPRAVKPYIILCVGVNGSGKTTTLGKLAARFKDKGSKVMMVAADTFRAAAIEQLVVWGDRNDVPVMKKEIGADAAALVYESYQKAEAENYDVVLIDTAGRLQNKQGLMDELHKITRVLKKHNPDCPHTTLLILDGTTGQNAVNQVETFRYMADIDGLVITKLDGSSKGGALVGIAHNFRLPVYAIGVGEKIEDLQSFDPKSYASAILDL